MADPLRCIESTGKPRPRGVTVGGELIEPSRTCRLATSDFRRHLAKSPPAAANRCETGIARDGRGLGKDPNSPILAQRADPDRPRPPRANHFSKLADSSAWWVAHQSAFICSAVAMFAGAVGSIAFVASSTSAIADILAGP